MVNKTPAGYEQHSFLPIPTYDEAISRPSSSQSFLGPEQISQDAERQGLLAGGGGHSEGYRAPTVESARSSLDGIVPSSGENSRTASTEELRREIQQMDVLEPGEDDSRRHLLAGGRFSKRITSLTSTLSFINLPRFRQWLPSWDGLQDKLPRLKMNWIIMGRFFALLLVVFLAYLLFFSDLFRIGRNVGPGGKWFDPEVLRNHVRDHVNESYIRENLQYLTSYDHMAGTSGGFQQAMYMKTLFQESYLDDVEMEQFDVYLNFPKDGGRRVAIVEPPEMAWEALIEEDMAYKDRKQTPVFHGHSRSGNVSGPLIYANYGSRTDFEYLENQSINLNGSIVVMRYYGSQPDRALKVKAAEMAGAAGCIIYSDPADDGQGIGYPDGRYMPSDGTQRGSVALTSWVVGDVLSPNFPSFPHDPNRISKDNNPGLPNIPSIPLAWRDAQKLLQALKGHGLKLDDKWGKGAVPDVEWWTGDSSSPIVQVQNEQDEVERKPIYNVLGRIPGVEQPEKMIIIGNHRDAWCFGAADPGSGTAIFLEVVRIFGELRRIGWRPLRTIVFAAWDGEEYNLIGSTEHVEARMDDLRRNAIAYLNVDVGVVGDDFQASASPVLSTALLEVLERVPDPASNKSLRAVWAEKGSTVTGLGAGSDYVAFQDMAGTSSLDMSFGGPPYPYHSCYDNFEWMEKFGDPGFQYHRAMGQIWALILLDLTDQELLPFDFEAYAEAVRGYVSDLKDLAKSKNAPLDLTALNNAVNEFTGNAREIHQWNQAWNNLVYGEGGGFESNAVAIKRIQHNNKMADFETNLLDIGGGLPGRDQYKHVIFAPQAWNGYGASFFPGVRDAVDDGDWDLAQRQVEKVAGILSAASRKLSL